MQEDIVDRLDKALATTEAYDQFTRSMLTDAKAEIERLRSVAGAVSDGPSLSDIRKTTGC